MMDGCSALLTDKAIMAVLSLLEAIMANVLRLPLKPCCFSKPRDAFLRS